MTEPGRRKTQRMTLGVRLAAAVAVSLLVAGCGTRLDDAQIEAAAGLVPGACFASAPRTQTTSEPAVAPNTRTASTARWLGQSVDAERVHVTLLRQEDDLVPTLRSGSFPLRHLETPLALALRRLAPGTVAGPIATDSGTYWVARE